jgi:ribonuclease HI
MRLRNIQKQEGVNKQYLINDFKKPTIQRRKEIEDYRFDNKLYRVYTDASELQNQGIFGLAFSFVGGGNIIVKSRKYYNQLYRENNVFAEIIAISFAINSLEDIFMDNKTYPEEVRILSDIKWIEQLEDSNWKNHPTKSQVLETVLESKTKFQSQYENKKLSILYIGKGDKRYNPYYTAAHNASRKVLKE